MHLFTSAKGKGGVVGRVVRGRGAHTSSSAKKRSLDSSRSRLVGGASDGVKRVSGLGFRVRLWSSRESAARGVRSPSWLSTMTQGKRRDPTPNTPNSPEAAMAAAEAGDAADAAGAKKEAAAARRRLEASALSLAKRRA